MPFECHFTGKKTTFGKKRAWRGQRIVKGGFGLKATGISRRTFKPNLQKVTCVLTDEKGSSQTKKVLVSVHAIRSGLVVKAPKRKYTYTRAQKAED
ncbi:MAG: 50S ribosomal protein L28 [Planctomycetes bacterium]|nr:50S ribosomal protein L28 [Planctomycetota bacterium]